MCSSDLENMSSYDIALDVPEFNEDRLSASSLILADQLEKVPTRSIGSGMFVIGSSKVRPRMNETFKQSETLGIYMQVYNFEPSEDTHKPEGTVTYQIIRNGTGEKVLEFTEDVAALTGGEIDVLGGTAWFWARPDAAQTASELFVDEAEKRGYIKMESDIPAGNSAKKEARQ